MIAVEILSISQEYSSTSHTYPCNILQIYAWPPKFSSRVYRYVLYKYSREILNKYLGYSFIPHEDARIFLMNCHLSDHIFDSWSISSKYPIAILISGISTGYKGYPEDILSCVRVKQCYELF